MSLRSFVNGLKAVKVRYEAAYASYYDSVGSERMGALNNFLDCQRQLGTMAPDLIEYALSLEQLLDRAMQGLKYYAERVDDPHYDVAKRTIIDIHKQLDGDDDGICSI